VAARSLATLTIAFGLVSIPVKLYSAPQPCGGVSFDLRHGTCGSRLRQQYVCLKDDVVVDRSEMIKGYEFAKGQYVSPSRPRN
jgi:DNA end-binding protein Ku